MKKAFKLAAAGAGAAALALGLFASPAAASGVNTVWGKDATLVSLYVNGRSNVVSSLEAGVLYPHGFNTICTGSARAVGTSNTGGGWSKSWGHFSGCIPTSWVSTTAVNTNFRSGTNITLTATHNGSANPGRPSVGIWA